MDVLKSCRAADPDGVHQDLDPTFKTRSGFAILLTYECITQVLPIIFININTANDYVTNYKTVNLYKKL